MLFSIISLNIRYNLHLYIFKDFKAYYAYLSFKLCTHNNYLSNYYALQHKLRYTHFIIKFVTTEIKVLNYVQK